MTNLALLCEDIVNGMMAANEFRGSTGSFPAVSGDMRSEDTHSSPSSTPLEVIVDIEQRNWDYKIQAGKF